MTCAKDLACRRNGARRTSLGPTCLRAAAPARAVFVQRVAAVFLALVLVGCGKSTHPVRGKVLYKGDGSPVPGGVTIWFESTTEPYDRASSVVERDGTFNLSTIREGSGAIEGEHRIRFEPAVPYADASAESALARTMPSRYREYRTSGLKQTIRPGQNECTVEVERPERR